MTLRAHRVSWAIHYGQVPDDIQVLHRCDNPQCVNPSHLFLGDSTDNNRDTFAKGRQPIGEQHGGSKLKWDQVREIRRRWAGVQGKFGIKALSRELGIHRKTFRDILNGVIWKE
jgi:hypothetical protein